MMKSKIKVGSIFTAYETEYVCTDIVKENGAYYVYGMELTENGDRFKLDKKGNIIED